MSCATVKHPEEPRADTPSEEDGAVPVRLALPSARLTSALAVLTALRRSPTVTAGDLVGATGLSRPTVLAACDDLIASGWAKELSAERGGGRGRPARTFAFDEAAAILAGVDVGWGSVNAMVSDLRGNELASSGGRIRHSASAAARLAAIQQHVTAACDRAGLRVDRLTVLVVGIAAPVLGDEIHAKTEYLRDLGTSKLRSNLEEWLPTTTVRLENDANLAAVAEQSVGAAAGERDLVALLAGERLGAGVISAGRLVHGARGAAGEIGAAAFLLGGTAEGAGYVVRTAAAAAVADQPGRYRALSERARLRGELTAAEVFEVAGADRTTHRLVVRALRPVAKAVALMHLVFDPRVVVIGGAVATAEGLVPSLLAAMPDHIELSSRPINLVASSLGGRAVLTGATTLARQTVWDDVLTTDAMAAPAVN